MKKLMFVAAAALAGSVFAAGEITSANVVGYQTYDLQAGYNLYSPTFEGVTQTLNIKDVTIQGSSGDGSEVIYFIDVEGQDAGITYYWLNPDNTGLDHWCWYDFNNSCEASFEVTPGMGLYIYSEYDGIKVQSAGSVHFGTYTKDLVAGYNVVGNFSPVDLDLQQIAVVGSTGDGSEVLYFIDAEGQDMGITYYWLKPDNTGLDHWCWYDFNNGEVIGETIKAGKGLYIYAEADGVSYTLPQVLEDPAK